jgi:hypothetical protein
VTAPALYDVRISHVRTQRIRRSFRNRGYLWLVDLDDLPELPRWLRPFARFRAVDHTLDPAAPVAPDAEPGRAIRTDLEGWLADHGVTPPDGRVLMLAQARQWGYVFNPLTVYWCHRGDGELDCVVAEVHNTYAGRHRYLLRTDERGRASAEKEFYVSPFLTVDGHYRMTLPRPDDRLALTVALHQQGRPALTASVSGVRRRATPAQVARLALLRPLATHRTWVSIHRHGIALWLRRLPVTPRSGAEPARTDHPVTPEGIR